MSHDDFDRVTESAARRYARAGRFARGMARGKLRSDPIYRALLERGVAEARSVTDLGCGVGLLLALILEARRDPLLPRLCGVELRPSAARRAREACGADTAIVEGNLESAPVPPSEIITLVDVLHYMSAAEQDRVLERARAALLPHGRLYVREADGSAGAGFRAVQLSERLAALARGEGWRPFAYRRAEAWARRLEQMGLEVAVTPMGSGTPFANVLLEARGAA